jgi:arsenical pump membrane protein
MSEGTTDGAKDAPAGTEAQGRDETSPQPRARSTDMFTVVFAAAALIGFIVVPNAAVRLALLTTAAVFTMSIVHRTAFEVRLTHAAFRRGYEFDLRFYVIPLVALGAAVAFGLVDVARAGVVVRDKYIIVLLILVFGLLAFGLRSSGYFAWAALRASRRGRGDTQRLLLNLFLVAAALTLVTSNDIMVFAFTPLVILMMRSSGIQNARMALLILFIAVNTSSMALYLGSPTNIILSQATDVSPFTYTFVMLVPTAVSLVATLIAVEALNRAAFGIEGSRLRRWRVLRSVVGPLSIPETYSTVQPAEQIVQDGEMRLWVRTFILAVVVVFAFGFLTQDLRIPVAIVGVITIVAFARSSGADFRAAMRDLPYQLVPFALTFFIVADAFGRTGSFREFAPAALGSTLQLADPTAALKLIAYSGLSANVFNDLPASALWGEALRLVGEAGIFDSDGGSLRRILALQTVLVGVNIGTYLTPFGALAGIIWLNQMAGFAKPREDDPAPALQVPNSLHLVAYGTVMFVFVGTVTAISLIAPLAIFDVLLSAPGEPATSGLSIAELGLGRWLALMVPSVGVILLLGVQSLRVMRRTKLSDDVRQWLLPISSAARRVILRAEISYRIAVIVVLVLVMGGLIQWVEVTHAAWHGSEGFATGGGFFSWFLIFVGSGEPIGDIFPQSWLGAVLAGLLPISALGGLVVVTRIPSGKWERRVREQLARGVIPSKRVVFVGFQPHHEQFIRQLREDDTTFVLLIVDPAEVEAASAFIDRSEDSRIHLVEAVRGATPLLEEYNLIPSLRYDPPLVMVFGAHRTGSSVESLRALSELCRTVGPATIASRPVSTTIIYECSSEDEYARTSGLRGRLEQTGHALVPIYAQRDYAELLRADLDADIDGLAAYLGLTGDRAHGLQLFRSPARIVAVPLDDEDLARLSGTEGAGTAEDLIGVVATVGGADAVFTPEDFQSLGIGDEMRRSTLRSALRMAGQGAGTLAEVPEEVPEEVPSRTATEDGRGERPLLVVVNDTARSRDFIARVRETDPSRRIRLVTGQRPNKVLHASLEVAQAGTAREAAESVLIDDEAVLPSGSRVFVFLREGEDHASEGWTLEFLQALEQLQLQVIQSGNGFSVPSHDELYVVVESRVHGEHGYEFVHNQLYVDSVFDPSMGERSVFATIAQLVAQYGLPEAPAPAAEALRSFAEAASTVGNVEVRRVADPQLFGDSEQPALVGLTGAEAAALVASRSFPPRRLLSVVRPERTAGTIRLVPLADSPEDLRGAVLDQRDLLLLLPSL